MALEDIMDAIAVNAAANLATDDPTTGLSGLKACYSTASSGEGATALPQTIADWPVGIVLPDSGELEPGNSELFLHDIELTIWMSAADPTLAYQVLTPLIGRCRTLFRSDLDANGTATRVLMKGYDGPETDEDAERPFLVLTIHLEALELTHTTYAM